MNCSVFSRFNPAKSDTLPKKSEVAFAPIGIAGICKNGCSYFFSRCSAVLSPSHVDITRLNCALGISFHSSTPFEPCQIKY